ncbi:hypothetical protein BH09PAT1_BH09PAT1_3110 [soil metagenome]
MQNDAIELNIIEYNKKYHDQMVSLLEEFYQYLIHIDPIKRLRILPGYGDAELKKVLNQIAEQEGIFYLAVAGSEIAGFITATIYRQTPEDQLGVIPSSVGRVTNLYISPFHRQKGLGTTLIKKTEEYVKSKGCDVMKIEVFAPNEAAQSLYQKLGYQPRDIDQIKTL